MRSNKCSLCGVEAAVTYGVSRRATRKALQAMGAPTADIVCLCGPCMDKAAELGSNRPVPAAELWELGGHAAEMARMVEACAMLRPDGLTGEQASAVRAAAYELRERLSQFLRR
jgi:hypothetical protein